MFLNQPKRIVSNNDVSIREIVKEGTILVTKRLPNSFYYHLGIVAVENNDFYVYDLHPDNKNSGRGSLAKRPLDDYMKDKKLEGIHHTGATTERIQSVYNTCYKGKYNAYHYQCQQFIDDITHKQFSSDLYSYYAGIILSLFFAGVVFVGATAYVISSKSKPA